MADYVPGPGEPTVFGDVWSGVPHYACVVCGWQTFDTDALTAHVLYHGLTVIENP